MLPPGLPVDVVLGKTARRPVAHRSLPRLREIARKPEPYFVAAITTGSRSIGWSNAVSISPGPRTDNVHLHAGVHPLRAVA